MDILHCTLILCSLSKWELFPTMKQGPDLPSDKSSGRVYIIKMAVATPDIYAFFDYRSYLKAAYEARKSARGGFSYRRIAELAGFSSAGFFTKILQGRSNVSEGMALRLAEVFHLKKHEMEYFMELVRYGQSENPDNRRLHFERLLGMRRSRVKSLEMEQFELFTHWHLVAIREALDFLIVRDNWDELGAMLWPAVPGTVVQQAIATLERLGLVQRHPDGYWERVEAVLSTGEDWHSYAIGEFQRTMLELARQSMENTPRPLRDYSTLTLSVSAESFARIRDILRDTRRSILEVARQDRATDRVLQLNMQLFPLTHLEGMP